MYINHDKAKKAFNTLIENEYQNWIIISGGSDSGKTSFIREVCPLPQTIFFETDLSFFYLNGLIPYISADVKLYLKGFLSKDLVQWNILKNKFNIDYINDIKEENYDEIIRMLICMDIHEKNYKYANYLGDKFNEKYSYMVLDNFYKCDKESYEWLLHFTNKYLNNKKYVIAICDFEKQWESSKVCEIFCDVQALIDIQNFDTEEDYFNVLKEEIYFDNIEILRRIATELFELYHGDAQLLLKTIKIYDPVTDKNDYDRQRRIFKIAHSLNFHTMKYSSKIHQLVLEFLALSPVPLSKGEISNLLEVEENIIQDILIEQYNENLLELKTKDGSHEIYYNLSDLLIRNVIEHNVEDNKRDFILNRLWTLTKSVVIDISAQAQVELSLELSNNESEELLWKFLQGNYKIISEEKQIEYINRLYVLDLHVTHKFSNLKNAKKLYDYGYYRSSLKMLEYLLHQKSGDYSFYMLLGDVQHLLLLPEAPNTFEQAANFRNITISQKLSAINRKIMSLNQSDQEGSLRARKLYDETFEKYSNEKCDGLIELYRNTNNSYSMEEALEFTIKGYYLALELNNTLEQYKCIQNICMIRLHQNLYPHPIRNLDINPSFELVDEYFQNNPQFYHKRAYPLLDLGTYEMMKYVSDKNIENLKKAKYFYSNAQLFAKSFYARNIAEVSLLVTNTHLYCRETYILDSLRNNRNELFMKYMNQDIVDYRVNRKILLSLAVSAVLTKDIEEAKKYLVLVRKYVWGQETLRYNNLCSICSIPPIKINAENYDNDSYYTSTEFVPWLISLGH